MLTLTVREWSKIRKQLREEYPLSVTLIREVMKRELGFTTRYHKEYNPQTGSSEMVHIDFYSEAAESWFRLRFL